MKSELLERKRPSPDLRLPAVGGEETLIDRLLAEQASLTAVGRFARKHEKHELPAQERYYRDLIPLGKPGEGEQYAFSVDLDTCTGCKACVSACHSLNGLDEEEAWRDIGLLRGLDLDEPYQQTVTTACHHCADPACLNGCPVKAYDKDAETGIVRHLDDQCIGCQYCILKCPYDVPKYSKKRGIVRKCDMCANRLAVGEAPACVQACPNGAIKITKVALRDVQAGAESGKALLPGAFASGYTKPSTVYRSVRGIPERVEAGGRKGLRLEHAHFPLIAMLLLTQTSAGLYGACAMLAAWAPEVYMKSAGWISLVGWGLLQAGLAASVFHLGRPLGAWRAFLGWRTSWMSREILAFGVLAAAATLATLSANWPWIEGTSASLRWFGKMFRPFLWSAGLMQAVAFAGVLAVFCSAMIYVDTRRPFWRKELSLGRFFGTMAWMGSALAAVLLAWIFRNEESFGMGSIRGLGWSAAGFGAVFLFWEGWVWLRAWRNERDELHDSARVMGERLRGWYVLRWLCFLGATGLLAAGCVSGEPGMMTGALALAAAAQLIERTFYFVAVRAPRMPGTEA